MSVKKSVFTIMSFLVFLTISGQNLRLEITQLGVFSSEDQGQSKVYINQEMELKEITIAKTLTQKESELWSIQIYMGSGKNSRAIANSTINGFKARYPEIDARLLYPSPYFKVQVGSFKSRIEAESFRQKILGEYPGARIELAINKEK